MLLRIALLAALATLALTAPANATPGHGPLEADVQAAHDYWASDVCGRQWVITPDAPENRTLQGGAATGIAFTHNPLGGSFEANGTRWDWHIERCEFAIDAQAHGCTRRDLIRHEIGHFVHGPGHEGPMAPAALAAASSCLEPVSAHAEPAAEPKRVKPKRVKRTRAQIARSLRYKRQMAKIRARAKARAACARR